MTSPEWSFQGSCPGRDSGRGIVTGCISAHWWPCHWLNPWPSFGPFGLLVSCEIRMPVVVVHVLESIIDFLMNQSRAYFQYECARWTRCLLLVLMLIFRDQLNLWFLLKVTQVQLIIDYFLFKKICWIVPINFFFAFRVWSVQRP